MKVKEESSQLDCNLNVNQNNNTYEEPEEILEFDNEENVNEENENEGYLDDKITESQPKNNNKSIVINRKKNLHKKISKLKEETQNDITSENQSIQEEENDKSISDEPSADDMDD